MVLQSIWKFFNTVYDMIPYILFLPILCSLFWKQITSLSNESISLLQGAILYLLEAKIHLAYTKNSSGLEKCSVVIILIDAAK